MSIFSNLKPDGGTKLHPFDLSRRDVFSAKSGVLNVNFIQHTIPESKYDVSHAQITRTNAIQTAPFARMSENFEYYFVPYGQIFHDFERLYYERGDAQRNPSASSYGSQPTLSSIVPVFAYDALMQRLAELFINSRILLKVKTQIPAEFEKLVVGLYSTTNRFQSSTWYLPFDVHGEVCIDEMLKLFDNLGYGNLFPIFDTLITPFFDFDLPDYRSVTDNVSANAYNAALQQSLYNLFGYVEDADQNPTYKDYPAFANLLFTWFKLKGVTIGGNDTYLPNWFSGNQPTLLAFKDLCDALLPFFFNDMQAAAYNLLIIKIQDKATYKPNLFALASYVKVFADIYRNSQYDLDDYSTLFNFDYVIQDAQATIGTAQVVLMLVPRFRQYKKDVFTGSFPNAQFGSVAVSSLQNPTAIMVDGTLPISASDNFVKVSTVSGRLGVTTSSSSGSSSYKFNLDSGVSALAIRQALSLQRYKERILRAGNRLTALQNAVFGDRSRFIEDNYVQFIGANKASVDFNSVAATSDAGLSEVGQLGSNGVSTHVGNAFQFHSHDFGILIGIYYILPESEYEAFMIDPMNTKSETNDYYKPDFMNLGLSPVWNYNFNFIGMDAGDERVLGYLANYWEYKTAVDKVHGQFYGSLPYLVDIDYNLPRLSTALARIKGIHSDYVTPRSGYAFAGGMSLSGLYVNPHDIDSIFYSNSDFTMITDQFFVNCNHDVKALLPMSVNGLPEF